MKNKCYLPLLLSWMACCSAAAQNISPCSTPKPEKLFEIDQETIQNVGDRDANNYTYVVQIFVHILRNTDGSNPAMSQADLENNLLNMANFFHPHNICFTLIGQDFIDNTTWNIAYTDNMINELHAVNPHSNAIDIYVHANDFEDSGGTSYDIPSKRYSVSAQTPFNFAHEMGHCLGLYHTFETAFGAECPNGSNCSSSGDLICDTPADFPGSEDWASGCSYNGTQTILCSSAFQTYNPSVNNVMSYFAECYSQFTESQGSRMRAAIFIYIQFLICLTPDNQTISDEVLDDEIALGAKNVIYIGNINDEGNVNMQGSCRGMINAGSFVSVLPGTFITPGGSNSITLRINNLCDGEPGFAGVEDNRREESNSSQKLPEVTPNYVSIAPNPFSTSTTLSYTIAEPSLVNLQIFNATGTLIANPVQNQQMEPGNYQQTFEAKDLPDGVYLIVLQKDGVRTAKRVVLAR